MTDNRNAEANGTNAVGGGTHEPSAVNIYRKQSLGHELEYLSAHVLSTCVRSIFLEVWLIDILGGLAEVAPSLSSFKVAQLQCSTSVHAPCTHAFDDSATELFHKNLGSPSASTPQRVSSSVASGEQNSAQSSSLCVVKWNLKRVHTATGTSIGVRAATVCRVSGAPT